MNNNKQKFTYLSLFLGQTWQPPNMNVVSVVAGLLDFLLDSVDLLCRGRIGDHDKGSPPALHIQMLELKVSASLSPHADETCFM